MPGRLVGDLFVVVQEAEMSRQRPRFDRSRSVIAGFLETETTGGVVLLGAAVVALIWANLIGNGYESFWGTELSIGTLTNDLRHWVNDGLMTLFFFVVGLEIKRELAAGDLRDPRVAAAPIVAAVGGMVVPAAIYLALNAGGAAESGWGIPMATDIAFVLGVNALLGSRTPRGLRLFLLTLAIVDDVGAIVVIAIFYSDGTQWLWLAAAAGVVVFIAGLRAVRLTSPLAYVLPATALWIATFESGIHPTIAGVVLGLATPAGIVRGRAVLGDLEKALHPASSYIVVPIFALANAGVALTFDSLRNAVVSRVFWGIAAGLLVGKVVGIVGAAGISRRFRLGRLPKGVGTRDLVGGAALAGIGFTVSLFIVGLAFDDARIVDEAKIGVLGGSLLSAVVGTAILWRTRREAPRA
ncbi:MAG: Na+/H+ antiporter NhaA [Actinomycetota bacterium]